MNNLELLKVIADFMTATNTRLDQLENIVFQKKAEQEGKNGNAFGMFKWLLKKPSLSKIMKGPHE